MEHIVMEKDEFQQIKNDIKKIKDALNKDSGNLQKKWLTTGDVASLFGISRRTVYYWVSKNILKPSKVSGTQLFDYVQIEGLLKKSQ